MSQAVLFTALIPLAILIALGIALVSGRLSPAVRGRLETGLLAVYPALAMWWLWQASTAVRQGDQAAAGLFGVAALVILFEAVRAYRRRAVASKTPR